MGSFSSLRKILASIAGIVMIGCGVSKVPVVAVSGAGPAPPTAQACTMPITGVMRDNLTGKPIPGGLAVLETGIPQVVAGFVTRIVNFTELTRTTSDAGGAFRLCAPSPVSTPAISGAARTGCGGQRVPAVCGRCGRCLGFASCGNGRVLLCMRHFTRNDAESSSGGSRRSGDNCSGCKGRTCDGADRNSAA